MAGVFSGVNAKCPYYVYEDPKKKEIKCHGIIPGTYSTQKFKRRAEYESQLRCFCDCEYWRCEFCCAMDGYWNENE